MKSINGHDLQEGLSEGQKKVRAMANDTARPIAPQCLHEGFLVKVKETPHRVALIYNEAGEKRTMTYGQLGVQVLKCTALLQAHGVRPGERVAVMLPKGCRQVIAVMAVLCAGAAYVPVGISHPPARKRRIFRRAGIRAVLTDREAGAELEEQEGQEEPSLHLIPIEQAAALPPVAEAILPPPEETAYVIFTSGSTGEPKGVVISHQGAWNTIADVNARFAITDADGAIAVSELDFDLSVYDIFGLLSTGGRLLILDEETKKEPEVWLSMLTEHGITVWNSVPAFYDMLMTVAEGKSGLLPLKRVLLSGDWVKPGLFAQTKRRTQACRFIALGGATEASIWSNYFEVEELEPNGRGIPYGRPLANQRLRVVNESGLDCPDYVPGELWIGGAGVAKGYLNQPELTKASFLQEEGIPWYRTGDLARYNEAGVVEFLGRMDTQVKLHGYRIELGEIEHAFMKHPLVSNAVAEVVDGQLGAVLEPGCARVRNRPLYRRDQAGIEEEALRQREGMAEKLILEICGLEQADRQAMAEEAAGGWNGAWSLWLGWLTARGVLRRENGRIIPGPRFYEAGNPPYAGDEVYRELKSRLPLLKAVLQGLQLPRILLEQERLTPEYLSCSSKEVEYYLNHIIGQLQEEDRKELRLAIVDARSGIAACRLGQALGPARLTLFDGSAGMLALARERLEQAGIAGEYALRREGYVESRHFHAYDAVLFVNTLHTWANPAQGLDYAACLLAEGGRFFAIEFEELDPLGLIVSALLEQGFAAGSPFRNMEQWAGLMESGPFREATVAGLAHSRAILLAGRIGEGEGRLELPLLRQYLESCLPPYMLPQSYGFFAWMPLTANGKVDRKQVKGILAAGLWTEPDEASFTQTEREVADIWKMLIPGARTGPEQSFFEAGGDSLLATRFLVEAGDRFNVHISLKEMFEKPKIGELAALIEERRAAFGEVVEGEL